MTLTFAGTLLALVVLVVLWSLVQTLMRYGARVLALESELGDCREFVEMRMTLRPLAAHAPVTLRPVPIPALAPARAAKPGWTPGALRAAA